MKSPSKLPCSQEELYVHPYIRELTKLKLARAYPAYPSLIMVTPGYCHHSFNLLRSEWTLIQWVCSMCHNGLHWYIFEWNGANRRLAVLAHIKSNGYWDGPLSTWRWRMFNGESKAVTLGLDREAWEIGWDNGALRGRSDVVFVARFLSMFSLITPILSQIRTHTYYVGILLKETEVIQSLLTHDTKTNNSQDPQASATADSAPPTLPVANSSSCTPWHTHKLHFLFQTNIRNFALVTKIIKKALLEKAKLRKEANECMQECANEFISFIGSIGSFCSEIRDELFQ